MKLREIVLAVSVSIMLVACNSTESALTVDSKKSAAAPIAAVNPPVETPKPTPASKAALSAATRLQFAPIIGAPVEQVTALSRRLTQRAKEKNLPIFALAEKNVSHVLKGYFSLRNEGGKVIVGYVFDVLDVAGNRLHRIQGEESTAAPSAAASWEAVPVKMMETIADRTIDDFAAWRSGPGA